jgi:hypothetical protein
MGCNTHHNATLHAVFSIPLSAGSPFQSVIFLPYGLQPAIRVCGSHAQSPADTAACKPPRLLKTGYRFEMRKQEGRGNKEVEKTTYGGA